MTHCLIVQIEKINMVYDLESEEGLQEFVVEVQFKSKTRKVLHCLLFLKFIFHFE